MTGVSVPCLHRLWSNRSACYKNLGDLDAALRDAERCMCVYEVVYRVPS